MKPRRPGLRKESPGRRFLLLAFGCTWLLPALILHSQIVGPALDVSKLILSVPAAVCQLDMTVLKGDVRRLSWSPDNAYIHVQTSESGERLHDYIVALLDGAVSPAFGEPEWAAAYWSRKSDLAAPGIPSMRIEVTQNNLRTKPTPFGPGGLNGAQTPDPKNPVDRYETEVTVRLLGEELGQWINEAPMAGGTFGWGPTGSGAILFADRRGRLTMMDGRKRKLIVPDVRGALMPAWSSDGSRIGYLLKSGRKTYRLMSATIASRD
jgi:hypothetical protein